MAEIALLSQETIDKIAAGEVIERPSSVVKELVENAIDANATAITVEIKDGGLSLIRITDNGCGIEKSQAAIAFLRHSTSKITSVEDLLSVSSLGFRGEALSSIAAVAQVELITKTAGELTGARYVIEGSVEKEREEIGAPDGTTFLVRNLFYNTPARRKFLKTAQTEAGYIHTLVERLALSRPDISFKFLVNNQMKLHTSGNSSVKDVIFQIYGREMTASLIKLEEENELFSVTGYIGNPSVSRGNRNFENYFINSRYIKSSLISQSMEAAYKNFLMQRQYPFCALYFQFDGQMLDVNVHPSKMELRFTNQEGIYQALYDCIRNKLMQKDHIKSVTIGKAEKQKPAKPKKAAPEPFEKNRLAQVLADVRKDSPYEPKYPAHQTASTDSSGRQTAQKDYSGKQEISTDASNGQTVHMDHSGKQINVMDLSGRQKISMDATDGQIAFMDTSGGQTMPVNVSNGQNTQMDILSGQKNPADPANGQTNPIETAGEQPQFVQEEIVYQGKFLSEQAKQFHTVLGQLFGTYWLVEYKEALFIIDQHAAHEKVLYEKTARSLKNKEYTSQLLSPPIILTLDLAQQQAFLKYQEQLSMLGFEIEPFGGKEYSVCGVPANLFHLDAKQVLLEILDTAKEQKTAMAPELVLEKIASMSCKAAVKGSHAMSVIEAKALIAELLELENPYFCPHGRPTIISIGKQELEKKFKRIIT